MLFLFDWQIHVHTRMKCEWIGLILSVSLMNMPNKNRMYNVCNSFVYLLSNVQPWAKGHFNKVCLNWMRIEWGFFFRWLKMYYWLVYRRIAQEWFSSTFINVSLSYLIIDCSALPYTSPANLNFLGDLTGLWLSIGFWGR